MMINTYDFKIAHPETFRQLAVKDMLFAYYKCPQVDKQVSLFTHFNEIGFTLSGKKTIHHCGKSWTLTEDKTLFFRKTAYNQELHETVGWEVLAFYFPDDFLRHVFSEYRQYLPVNNLPPPPTDMIMEINVSETTRAFFYSMIPYFTQKHPPEEHLLELKFKELLVTIFADPSNSTILSYVSNLNDQDKVPLWQVMESNYMYNLTIPEYARIAHRSVASFNREFREYYQTTPGKWLTHKRIEYAQLLLNSSKKNISEVAYESGFENASHFSRIFKERYGTSPLQYRKKK